jgi:hypothetical protein
LVNERRIALHGDLLGRAILHVGNSTFSDNIGPIIANNSGAELFIGSTILNVSRAEFTGALAIVNSHNSKVTSVGYNLASDGGVWNRGSTGALDQMGDQLNTYPRLGPLEDNGGPTFTHSLLCASPAIDQGMNWMLSSIDQRGFARSMPVTGLSAADGTDIGAFEAQEIPVCFRVHVKGPVEQIGDLIAQINMLTQIKAATRHHLLVKLEAALKAVHSGHTATACHQMTDFIHATNAQKEKQLVPASIADDLIANGARIKVVLGCP